MRHLLFTGVSCVLVATLAVTVGAGVTLAQSGPIKGTVAAGTKPTWEKGIVGITPESYYNAIECGKQPGNPTCLFWDADLCKNPDFELALNTPYKAVAYEVWYSVRQKKPAPQPNYQNAQQTRVTVGITAVKGSKNTLTGFSLKRAGKAVQPLDGGVASSRFTYDFPAFAPTGTVTFDIVGKERTVSCTIDAATLRLMR
jgi:hypothetical protein